MSRLRANQITNQSADGAPTVQNGLIVTGVTTSTSFSGSLNASNLTGTVVDARLSSITASKLTGALPAIDGSSLTGVSGFGTALSNDTSSLLNLIFKTPEAFTIGAGTSISIESDNTSGNTAFTRLGRINVSTGATFHVSAGTTFVMNVLNVF